LVYIEKKTVYIRIFSNAALFEGRKGIEVENSTPDKCAKCQYASKVRKIAIKIIWREIY